MMRELKISQSITSRNTDSLNKYLVDINRYPLLTPEEETDLAEQVKLGGRQGREARDQLVKSNLRFVVSVAKQYQHRGLGLTDLIDEGNIGLLRAADKFDPTRGFKFISYAVWWIRQSILQALAEKSRTIRLPLNQVDALTKISNQVNDFEQKHQRQPTAQEIAEMTNISEEKVSSSLTANQKTASLDAPIGEDGDGSLSDIMAEQDDPTDKEVMQESATSDIHSVLCKALKPREMEILCEGYGLGCRERGLSEIAEQTGLSRERVRQIMVRSLDKVRKSQDARRLRQYLG